MVAKTTDTALAEEEDKVATITAVTKNTSCALRRGLCFEAWSGCGLAQ